MNMQLHPLCTLFPRVQGPEFLELVKDIKDNGLREPIATKDGMVLDGGNRYAACLEAGIEPTTAEYGGSDIVAFVFSKNLHRRHLNEGQRAAIVASAQDWQRAQRRGGDRKSDQPARVPLDSQADRAAAAGVSERTQRKADKVVKAAPVMAAQVARGEKSLNEAVREVSPQATAKPTKPAKPAPAPELSTVTSDPRDEEIATLKEQLNELTSNLDSAVQEIESMARVFEANDQVAAAVAEAKRYREQARIADERIRGLMGEKNTALSQAKMWMNKFRKLEKEMSNADSLGVAF